MKTTIMSNPNDISPFFQIEGDEAPERVALEFIKIKNILDPSLGEKKEEVDNQSADNKKK